MTTDIDTQITKAQERIAKLQRRKAKVAAEAELAKRKAELTQAVQSAVKQALNSLKLDVPDEGFTLFVQKGEGGTLSVNLKIGRRSGSDGRKSISALGHSGFILPDGKKADSAAKVLDHFGVAHKNDSAARLILKWAKDDPDKAQGVKVVIGKEKVSLVEAVSRI